MTLAGYDFTVVEAHGDQLAGLMLHLPGGGFHAVNTDTPRPDSVSFYRKRELSSQPLLACWPDSHARRKKTETTSVKIEVVGFDGDDTLWYHGREFVAAQKRILAIVSRYTSEEEWDLALSRTEVRNLRFFGYGVGSFTLSAVEAAIEATRGRITAFEISELISIAKYVADHEIEIVEGTESALRTLKESHKLVLITKGKRAEQARKISKSSIVHLFDSIEIVHEKDEGVYASILRKHKCLPRRFVMVGNSMKSDILPVLEMGGWAVHIPYEIVWHHEKAERPEARDRFFSGVRIVEVPQIINAIEAQGHARPAVLARHRKAPPCAQRARP